MNFESSSEITKTVEEQANSPEHPTLLMIKRFRNPEIKKQVITQLLETEAKMSQIEKVVSVKGADGKPLKGPNGKTLVQFLPSGYTPKSRETLEREYGEKVAMLESSTPISFSDEIPSGNGGPGGREIINLNFRHWKTGENLADQQKAIVEAHEKGHVLRKYFYLEEFLSGFDPSQVKLTRDHFDAIIKHSNPDREYTLKETEQLYRDALFTPVELAERMSQLKNYFGMQGSEVFTKTHLDYARDHYVPDTGLDNDMTQFFTAVTSEKEEAFLDLINSTGI